MLVLRNCRLVKALTEGYEEQYGDVLIDGRYISDIQPMGHVFGGEYEEIDLQKKTLIPGLIEMISLSLNQPKEITERSVA